MPDSKGLGKFYELYAQTMEDVGARQYYFFNKAFFEKSLQVLSGHLNLFLAHYQEHVIAASMFIWGLDCCHYHFSATNRNFSHIGGSKLLLYKAMLWAREQGMKKFHLGGGFGGSDSDSLMLFKSGFSKLRADFYIAKRVHNPEVYAQLCKAVNLEPEQEPFFPVYRASQRR